MTVRFARQALFLMSLGLCQLEISAAQFTVSWNDNSTNETGFRIERSTDAVTFTQIATVGANVTNYVDSTIAGSTTYSYRVAAYNDATTSAYSNVASYSTPADPVAPIITTQPIASQTMTVGTSVSFTVSASGSPAPSFQWKKNNIVVSGGTNAQLTINSVTSLDAGTYTVVISNSAGSVVSASAVLNVQAAAPSTAAPTITTQPTAQQSPTAGSDVALTVAASGSPTPTFQWKLNGAAIAGATSATLNLHAVTSLASGTYTVVATNSAGSATSNNAVVNVQPAQPAATVPTITTQPVTSQTLVAGGSVTLSVAATGNPLPTFQWKKDGSAISGATSAMLSLPSATMLDSGTYVVVVTNSAGNVTSTSSVVTVQAIASPTANSVAPSFSVQPVALQTISPGSPLSLSAAATGTPAPSYQWQKNGVPITGATSGTLVLSSVSTGDAGTYIVVASNSGGSALSSSAVVQVQSPITASSVPSSRTVSTVNLSRLSNLAVRAIPGADDRALFIGFVVEKAAKSMLVRAVGPGLATYTDAAVYQDPKLMIYDGSSPIATNDNWGGSDLLKQKFTAVGAFPLPDASKDAVVLTDLAPKAYTATVSGPGSGLALAEIYDADVSSQPTGRLVNLSARAYAGPGSGVLIVGFVIAGDTPLRVLIRGIGPALVNQGVPTALVDPQLDVYSGSTLLQHNDDWAGTPELKTAFTSVGAFALPDSNSKDAAVIMTLQPGAYTAIVSGVSGADGIALAEVYEVR